LVETISPETSSSGANNESEDTSHIKRPIPPTIIIVTKIPKTNQVFFKILKIFLPLVVF